MDIEELLRSRKFEKLDLTKDLTDLEYEQLFNALDQDPNLPKIVYGDGGGIRILCQSEDRRHNSECFCEGFLIYETVCSSKDSAHYIGNRLSGYWCSITSSWQGCHEERIKRAKALREKEAKVPTRYDKFKALVESNETSWDEVAKFTHEANFAINESDATPEVLSISQIRRKGSWSGALWDKYHWIKAFWYLLRFDRVEDKVPAGTKYIGITSEKKIVYKDSESNVLTEPFTLKLVETTSWKSILTFKKTMLDTIRSKNILEMIRNFEAGDALEICLVDRGNARYNPNTLNIKDFVESSRSYNWINGLLGSSSKTSRAGAACHHLRTLLTDDKLSIDPKYAALKIYADGSAVITDVNGDTSAMISFVSEFPGKFGNPTTLDDEFRNYVQSGSATVEGVHERLVDNYIYFTETSPDPTKNLTWSGLGANYSWHADVWSDFAGSNLCGLVGFARFSSATAQAGVKKIHIGADGKKVRIFGIKKNFTLPPEHVTLETVDHLTSLPLNSLSTRDLLLYLSAMEDLEDIDTIGGCLEELEVTFPGFAPSWDHRSISVEDYKAILDERCYTWSMLVGDRTRRQFFNGDQYTDIAYYLKARQSDYERLLRSINFNLAAKTVTFVYKDRTSTSFSMSDFKNRPFPVTPESQEQTQNTPETPMATQNSTDQNIVNLLAQARRDGRRMAVRTGARELVLTVRDPLAAALANALGPGDADVQRKVALFMSGPLGEALVGAVASAGLHVVNGKLITKATQMEIANEVADELKIEAGAKVMGIFTGMVMGPVRDIMVGTINSIAAKEDQPQIAPPMETPAVGLGSGSNEKIVEPIEECVAEKIEVKK